MFLGHDRTASSFDHEGPTASVRQGPLSRNIVEAVAGNKVPSAAKTGRTDGKNRARRAPELTVAGQDDRRRTEKREDHDEDQGEHGSGRQGVCLNVVDGVPLIGTDMSVAHGQDRRRQDRPGGAEGPRNVGLDCDPDLHGVWRSPPHFWIGREHRQPTIPAAVSPFALLNPVRPLSPRALSTAAARHTVAEGRTGPPRAIIKI